MNRVKQITVGASRGRDVAAGSGGGTSDGAARAMPSSLEYCRVATELARKGKCPRQQRLELRSTRFSNCITSFDKDNLLLIEYE